MDIIDKLISAAMNGGPQAIIGILVVIIVALYRDRHRMLEDIKAKDEKIDSVINDYYKGNITLAEALNSLKIVLYEIKSGVMR